MNLNFENNRLASPATTALEAEISPHAFVRLRGEAIEQIMAEQQLKKWWVAETTGVHKTTLRRWLSGKIERVRTKHALALASVLTVDGARIAVPD